MPKQLKLFTAPTPPSGAGRPRSYRPVPAWHNRALSVSPANSGRQLRLPLTGQPQR